MSGHDTGRRKLLQGALLAAATAGTGTLRAAEQGGKTTAAAPKPAMPALTQVAEGLLFPEGPIAMADGSIVLVEMRAKTLTRIGRDGKRSVIAELGGGPNGAAIGPDGAAPGQ